MNAASELSETTQRACDMYYKRKRIEQSHNDEHIRYNQRLVKQTK